MSSDTVYDKYVGFEKIIGSLREEGNLRFYSSRIIVQSIGEESAIPSE